MNSNMKRLITIVLALAMVLALAACGKETTTSSADSSVEVTQTGVSDASEPTSTNADMFTDRDLDPSYDSATTIDLSKKSASKVTISEAGTYILTGTYNGQIVVNVGDEDKVQLVLDNVTLTNSESAAIYVQEGDKVFITLKDGTTNKISSSASFESADEETGDKVNATIWSKATLVFNGEGSLTVTSDNGSGIVSKDDLKITSGTLKVTAKNKGIVGKDSVRIHNGLITIEADDDGVHISNDTDEDKGFFYMEGGTLNISSGDDGIHAETELTIEGGVINVTKSYEGLEGQDITINGGEISIVASDDGINASEGGNGTDNTDMFGGRGGDIMDNQNASLTITGGTINVNANGDGLDSNGTLIVSGGTTYVSGPTNGGNGAIDCDNASISGGTVVAAGSSGMAVNFGSDSTQASMLVTFDSTVSADTKVVLKDSDGNTILSYTPEKDYQSVVISSPDIEVGETYTVSAGDESQTIEMTDTIYGSGNHMGGGGMGGGMGGRGGFSMGGNPGTAPTGAPDAQTNATAA